MRYAHPGQPGAVVSFKSAYGNFIDGRFVEPLSGEFFMNTSPRDRGPVLVDRTKYKIAEG